MEGEIVKIFAEIMGRQPESVNLTLPFKEIEGWDSLKHMELVVRMEDKFAITFTGDEIGSFTALKDVVQIIGRKNNA